MNLIIADGCGNNYPVSPCPPPSTTVPPPPTTAQTGGGVVEPGIIGGVFLVVAVLALVGAKIRRKGTV